MCRNAKKSFVYEWVSLNAQSLGFFHRERKEKARRKGKEAEKKKNRRKRRRRRKAEKTKGISRTLKIHKKSCG